MKLCDFYYNNKNNSNILVMDSLRSPSPKNLANKTSIRNEVIDFKIIRSLFGLKNKANFIHYLEKIYPDFCSYDENFKPIGFSLLNLVDLIKIPVFICEKFFYSINKHKSHYLSFEELCHQLCKLYFGSLEETSSVIFSIYDFDHDSIVQKDKYVLLCLFIE